MINLNHLRYFYVCAQKKSVTRAADALGISQPSLSLQLKTFEQEVGETLFVRNGRTLDLSPKGKALYEESKGLFEYAESISQLFDKSESKDNVSFRIGVSSEIERPFVAEIVGKLLRNRTTRKIRFVIVTKGQPQLSEDLRSSDLDLVITNYPLGKRSPDYEFNFPVFLVTTKDQNELKHINNANLAGILRALDQNLIVPSEGIALREELNQILRKIPDYPDIIFESNILACTVRAIKEGIGCGFVPLPYIREDYKHGLLSVIGPTNGYWQHKVYFFSSSRADTHTLNSLAQVVQESVL